MLRENNLTGALIELGFLSNKGDREYLLDPVNQKIMALGIAKSIYNYFCAS
jgi:N-acetylmuramoyl-L-alanine amidase